MTALSTLMAESFSASKNTSFMVTLVRKILDKPNFVSNPIMIGVVVAFGLIIVGFLSDKPVWFWFSLPVLVVGVGLDSPATRS